MTRLNSNFLFVVALGLFLTVMFYTFRHFDLKLILDSVGPGDFLINMALGLAWFVLFGAMLRWGFKTHYQVSISSTEVLTLPLMMHLFLHILPMNGGLVFQVFYMKHRHHLDLSKGLSFGFQIFLVSLLITVILGLALNYILGLGAGPLLYLLLLLGLCLLILPLFALMVPSPRAGSSGLFVRFFGFFSEVRSQFMDQLTHPRLMLQLAATTTLLVLVQALWYQQSAHMLGFESEFLPLLLVALVLRIVLLLRLLPGNLGVQELMIGVVFAAAGFSIEEGLLVALVIRLVSVLLAATIGMWALHANLSLLNADSMKSMLRSVSEAR